MREGMAGKFRDIFSRSDKSDSNKRPEDFDSEDTMIYEPGQKEVLLKEHKRETQKTQYDISSQGQDVGEFVRQDTEVLSPGKTVYEKANEGDVEDARHEVITKLFNNALYFDHSSIGRVKEDSIDPVLAHHHLMQAKELKFPEYKQMRDKFMEVIPEALKRNKIQGLPEGSDPKYKDPKVEAQKYILEIEKEIVGEMDEQIEAAA